ncbi:MAG TPA: aldo/keto reductase [Gemmatimonadaceae bacterium]|nr:aldo/keto reductase [Gemmatimonadaceae bacterium]
MPEDTSTQTQTLPVRSLGETGESVTILGLGGGHLARVHSEYEARELVDVALDEGIRFFDTAESYHNGTSERWLGAALGSRRADVFLMSKTFDFPERSAEGAKWHLEGSLTRLATDRLDLWQLHSVRSVTDVDRAFGKGGAMEFILEMKMKGLVRFTGVTGHKDPDANLRALHYWDRGMRFDAMQMPINPIDHHQRSFQERVLPELVRRNIGVIAMKTSADGALPRAGVCTHAECHRFAWGLPVSVAVVGMERPELIRENARLARSAPMSPSERATLLARVAPSVALDLEYYKRD